MKRLICEVIKLVSLFCRLGTPLATALKISFPYHSLRGGRGQPEVGVALDVAEVAVEVGAVRLLESGAEAEVGQLDVPAGVQQQVVRLYVSAREERRTILRKVIA